MRCWSFSTGLKATAHLREPPAHLCPHLAVVLPLSPKAGALQHPGSRELSGLALTTRASALQRQQLEGSPGTGVEFLALIPKQAPLYRGNFGPTRHLLQQKKLSGQWLWAGQMQEREEQNHQEWSFFPSSAGPFPSLFVNSVTNVIAYDKYHSCLHWSKMSIFCYMTQNTHWVCKEDSHFIASVPPPPSHPQQSWDHCAPAAPRGEPTQWGRGVKLHTGLCHSAWKNSKIKGNGLRVNLCRAILTSPPLHAPEWQDKL